MLQEQIKFIYILLLAIFVWLIATSFLLTRALSHYRKLTHGAKDANLEKILESILTKQDLTHKNLVNISESLAATQKQILGYFQKSALIRFNPFEDAGGDQSFAVALLDAHDSGIVISSLHSRSGTRIYAKSVTSGKASGHAFTKEEKEAVDKAARVGKIG